MHVLSRQPNVPGVSPHTPSCHDGCSSRSDGYTLSSPCQARPTAGERGQHTVFRRSKPVPSLSVRAMLSTKGRCKGEEGIIRRRRFAFNACTVEAKGVRVLCSKGFPLLLCIATTAAVVKVHLWAVRRVVLYTRRKRNTTAVLSAFLLSEKLNVHGRLCDKGRHLMHKDTTYRAAVQKHSLSPDVAFNRLKSTHPCSLDTQNKSAACCVGPCKDRF